MTLGSKKPLYVLAIGVLALALSLLEPYAIVWGIPLPLCVLLCTLGYFFPACPLGLFFGAAIGMAIGGTDFLPAVLRSSILLLGGLFAAYQGKQHGSKVTTVLVLLAITGFLWGWLSGLVLPRGDTLYAILLGHGALLLPFSLPLLYLLPGMRFFSILRAHYWKED